MSSNIDSSHTANNGALRSAEIDEKCSMKTNGSAKSNGAHSTSSTTTQKRPRRSVYMDGVFDLYHIGHIKAIQQCMTLGDRVIIGVVGDEDAASYKRPPILCEEHRKAMIESTVGVDEVVCPCPLVMTEEFLEQQNIDLVVHGFADDADAERQREFFRVPIEAGKFQRIGYYSELSTTSIIEKIRSLPPNEES